MKEAASNLDPLILDFLEWLAPSPRPYGEVMEAWRTSCPRLTVREDSIARGFVAREGRVTSLAEAGRDFLAQNGRMTPGGLSAAPSGEESREKTREEGRR